MRVAILDDYHGLARQYLPPALVANPHVVIFEHATPHHRGLGALVDLLRPYDVISTMRERTPFPAELLRRLPNLKILLTTGTYNAAIDMDECQRRGIVVAGTPAPPMELGGTVQHTWALILALADNIPRDHALLTASPAWATPAPLNTYLTGKTLGIVGLGRLGRVVARIGLLAFGMDVVAWSPHLTQATADAAAGAMRLPAGVFRRVGKRELLRGADVVSVHLVLGEGTRGVLGQAELALMKPSALLVNTARAALVDDDALLEALERGAIRGAAVDVFDAEPLPRASAWRTTRWGEDGRSQVVMTPHTGYAFEEMMGWMWRHTAENLVRVVEAGGEGGVAERVKWRIEGGVGPDSGGCVPDAAGGGGGGGGGGDGESGGGGGGRLSGSASSGGGQSHHDAHSRSGSRSSLSLSRSTSRQSSRRL